MTEGLFNTFCQEHRLLSLELERRASAEFVDLQRVSTTVELDAFEPERVRERIGRMLQVPSLTTVEAMPVVEAGWRRVDASTRIPTYRYAVRVNVVGDAGLLEYWPDEDDSGLKPIDHQIVEDLGEADARGTWSEDETTRYWDAKQTWRFDRTPGSPNEAPTAIVTHQHLTREEEQTAAGTNTIRDAFIARRRRIEPIVAAIARQVERYCSVALPARIAEIVQSKREEFGNREAVSSSLTFPPEWSAAEPSLDRIGTDEAETVTESRGAPEPGDARPEVPFDDIVLNPRARLSPASFADVQRTIRVWADSIEQYPKAFNLHEDRVSDLLTATLNATLPGAQREVYRRGGKSDIYISADVLAQGSGPAKVFICESKWARSRKVVAEALDPQLFGYLNADDTAAVLLLLLRQTNKSAAIKTRIEWLRSVSGLVKEGIGEVDGWPVWRFRREGRHVDICMAFVHIPST